jgi:predicted amidohydrolase YtcJ
MRPLLLLCLSMIVSGAAGPSRLAPAPGTGPQPVPELVLLGGVVWMGEPGAALEEAIAITNGRVEAVGTNAYVLSLVGERTRVINLNGRMVVPGFADNHTHFMSGGFQLASVDLRDAASPRVFADRIGAFARGLTPGSWVTGGDWDHELWPGGPLPLKSWIDEVTPRHPVAVRRLDGHMLLANSLALRMAGITRDTPDPPGGTIVRDPETGEATGVLKDEAMSLVTRLVPARGAAARTEAFRRAQEHALALGVTMVHDMGDWSDLETYRNAYDAGELKLRIYSFVPLSTWERLRDYVAEHGRGDDLLRWGGLKGFVDGSLGSTTAWFHEPYDDEPSHRGLLVTDSADLRRRITGADAAGLHVAVHAIGDNANDWLLDTYQVAAQQNGARDRRFRVEHAQHFSPAAAARFAQLGVLPSMQPYHAIDDGRWAEKRIGADRIRRTYAFRSLLDADATLLFGSDWTVAPLDPLLGIYGAVTRRTLDGAHPDGWVAAEKISVAEALRAYTAANAYGAFMEDRLGTLAPGRLADLVVLSENLLALEPGRLRDVRVDFTVIGGRVVYERWR